MSKYRYKNETDSDLSLVGFGVVEAGGEIESDVEIENPNLTAVGTKAKKQAVNEEEGDGRA